MFYRNLLVAAGVVSLVVALAAHFMTDIEIAVSPAFLFWYLMGLGTVLVIGAALADLWTRSAASLRSLEGQVRDLTAALQRVTGENRDIAASSDTLHQAVLPSSDADQ